MPSDLLTWPHPTAPDPFLSPDGVQRELLNGTVSAKGSEEKPDTKESPLVSWLIVMRVGDAGEA